MTMYGAVAAEDEDRVSLMRICGQVKRPTGGRAFLKKF
jgi:hypothetical protein